MGKVTELLQSEPEAVPEAQHRNSPHMSPGHKEKGGSWGHRSQQPRVDTRVNGKTAVAKRDLHVFTQREEKRWKDTIPQGDMHGDGARLPPGSSQYPSSHSAPLSELPSHQSSRGCGAPVPAHLPCRPCTAPRQSPAARSHCRRLGVTAAGLPGLLAPSIVQNSQLTRVMQKSTSAQKAALPRV